MPLWKMGIITLTFQDSGEDLKGDVGQIPFVCKTSISLLSFPTLPHHVLLFFFF